MIKKGWAGQRKHSGSDMLVRASRPHSLNHLTIRIKYDVLVFSEKFEDKMTYEQYVAITKEYNFKVRGLPQQERAILSRVEWLKNQ